MSGNQASKQAITQTHKMSTVSSKQKQKERVMAQFMSFTQSNEKSALNFLNQYDWKLDLAVDAYYLSLDSGHRSAAAGSHASSTASSRERSSLDRKKLDQIWNLYRGILLLNSI